MKIFKFIALKIGSHGNIFNQFYASFCDDTRIVVGSFMRQSFVKGHEQKCVPRELHRIFEEEQQLKHSTKVAVICQGQSTTPTQTSYRLLNERANRAARLLVKKETHGGRLQPNKDGDFIVAVCMQPSEALVTTLLAIWKAGGAYLPIDPSFPANRIRHILLEAKPIIVICDDDINAERFEGTNTLSVTQLFSKSLQLSTANLHSKKMLPASDDHIAIVLYTSGSTGVPKGVRLSHGNILNRLQWQWSKFPYTADETVGVFKTALTFVDSIAELWSPLMCGLAILVVPKAVTKDPEGLVALLDQYRIRRLVLVPSLLRSLLLYLKMESSGSSQKLLNNLNIWICSGEPLSMPLALSFFDYFDEGVHNLYNFYGSTEVMGDVTFFTCDSKKQLSLYEKVPIGIPVSNTLIYLLDADYLPVKNGEIGEIFVSGLNLAAGYVSGRDPDRFLNNPLSVEKKYARLYRTGDYGSLHNGNIMYEGRTDSQVKILGNRVDLSEVEKNVTELPEVEKAIVLCYRAGHVDRAILAFVKLRKDLSINVTEKQLEDRLMDKMVDYMRPQVIIVEQVPLLVNGKIDRQALLKTYDTAIHSNGDSSILVDFDYSEVPEELQITARVLFETVAGVIGRSTRLTLSPNSKFYELGGNSINSILTISLLRDKGYNVGISEFIAAQNLGEIIEKMSANRGDFQEKTIIACPHLKMEAVPLRQEHRQQVTDIIVASFYNKGDLELLLKPEFLRTDYRDILNDTWNALVERNLSFVIYDRNTDSIIGVSLNFDARNEPKVEIKSKLVVLYEFMKFCEAPFCENYLPKGLNKVMRSSLMGTAEKLNPLENIACMHFMEQEVLRVAREKKFVGIFTTNTSPLTQQLADYYDYKTLLNYQVNEYISSDGSRPFGNAPDEQRAIVHWKDLEK